MTDSDNKRLLAALEANWQAEMEGYYAYSALAKGEDEPQRRNALRGLATAEKHHADLWARRLGELSGQAPQYTGLQSGQADSLATRVGGSDLALRRLEIDEGRDIAKYGKELKALGDEPSIAILNEVIADEREHYQTLGNLIRSRRPLPALPPEQAEEALESLLNARKEGHPEAASWVGDAIYGINDGLGSIFGIVSSVSGATLGNSHFVLIAGLAGMVASALWRMSFSRGDRRLCLLLPSMRMRPWPMTRNNSIGNWPKSWAEAPTQPNAQRNWKVSRHSYHTC